MGDETTDVICKHEVSVSEARTHSEQRNVRLYRKKEWLTMEIKEYSFTQSGSKLIERIIDDENTNINHVVLPEGEGLPPHFTNSNVYILALRGTAQVRLNGELMELSGGEILAIPVGTSMELNNTKPETFEMFIVKAPAPKNAGIK